MFRVKVTLWRDEEDLLPELTAKAQGLWQEPKAWLAHSDEANKLQVLGNQHRFRRDSDVFSENIPLPQTQREDEPKNSTLPRRPRSNSTGMTSYDGRSHFHLDNETLPPAPSRRRLSTGSMLEHDFPETSLPENEFWVSEKTIFADLCEDAMRYFMPASTKVKLRGKLVNGQMAEWGRNDRVLARLNACPSDRMRQVILRVGKLRPWESHPKENDEAAENLIWSRVDEFYPSDADCCKEVSTLQAQERALWRRNSIGSTSGGGGSNGIPLRDSIHQTLRGIYTEYSLRGRRAEDGGISLQSFLQFILECRIPIPRERVTLIYVSVQNKRYEGFLSMLVRLAQVTHSNTCRSPQAALEALLNEYVAPYSARWETTSSFDGSPSETLFLQLEQSSRLHSILARLRVVFSHAFDAYCVRDPGARVRKAQDRFITLGQFQLFTQDLELYTLGSHLDARLTSKIYVTCCEYHSQNGDVAALDGKGKMGWKAFVQAIVRLAIILAVPLEIQKVQDRSVRAERDRWFASVMLRNPELPIKGLLQHLHFNIFGRPVKLRVLCQRLENRHWRRGPVTPLGTQVDIVACAQKLAKEFNALWEADQCPDDYYRLIADGIRDCEREEHEVNAANAFAEALEYQSLANAPISFENQSNISSSSEVSSSLPPATTDHAGHMTRYINEACQQAEDSMLEAVERFTRRADACVQLTRGTLGLADIDKALSMSECVQLYEVATLRFRSILRSLNRASAEDLTKAKWRWALAITGLASRLQAGCQDGILMAGQSRPFADGWGFCSWDALIRSASVVRPPAHAHHQIQGYSNLMELCDFARACVEYAEPMLGEVLRWHRNEMKLSLPSPVPEQKNKDNGKKNEERNETETDEDDAFQSNRRPSLEDREIIQLIPAIGANIESATTYQLTLDQASALRLQGSLRMLVLRIQLVCPQNRYATNESWDSASFFRSIARSALAADHYFGCAASNYEKVRFSKFFRVSLLNNWSFVLFERGQVKALAMAALERATMMETNMQVEPSSILQASRLDKPIHDALSRSRQLVGLGFELALPTHANREWLLPVALLWTWTNCIQLTAITSLSLRQLVAKAVTPRRGSSTSIGGKTSSLDDINNVFALGSVELSKLLMENARIGLTDIFDTTLKDLNLPSQDGTVGLGTLSCFHAEQMIMKIFSWDKNEYYIQLFRSQVKAQGFSSINLAKFLSFMVYVALEDPIGFTKSLYLGDALKKFELEDSRPTRKVPTSLFIASLLYPSFADSAHGRRHRRSHIRRLSTPSPLMFEDDHNSPHGRVREPSVYIEARAAVAENYLIDHFLVLDAHQFRNTDTLKDLSSLADATLQPRVRNVWPPTVEDLLEEPDELARRRFTIEQLAGFRALHEQAPLPEDLVSFCFRKESYTLLTTRPGISSSQQNDESQQVTVTPLVLTDGVGTRRYAMVLTFYEEVDPYELLRPYNQNGAVDHLLKTVGSRHWFAPTSLCVLSRWPMYDTFEKFLRQTLRLSKMETPLPLERYIANFISETPVPPPGEYQVQTIMYDLPIYIRRPASNELPLSEVSMTKLFENLSVGTVLAIFACLLTEQKVALCCADEDKLTPVAEAIRAIMFPLDLQCIYIPVLPAALMDFLFAPVPFFMGVNSSCIDLGGSMILPSRSVNVDVPETPEFSLSRNAPSEIFEMNSTSSRISNLPSLRPRSNSLSNLRHSDVSDVSQFDAPTVAVALEPADVVYIDLDRNLVILPFQADNRPLELPTLPKIGARKLRDALSKLVRNMPRTKGPTSAPGLGEASAFVKSKEAREVHARTSQTSFTSRIPKQAQTQAYDLWCQEVRGAFLSFHVRQLRNYKRYIVRKRQEIDWTFDRNAFLAEHTSSRDFYTRFLGTQLFEGFIQDAVGVQNGQDNIHLRLFDEFVIKAENRPKANRLYTRPKKKAPTPLLDDKTGHISKTHFVALAGQLLADEQQQQQQQQPMNASSRAVGRSFEATRATRTIPKGNFPDLVATQLGARGDVVKPLVEIANVQVPFAKVEISEIRRTASQHNLIIDQRRR